MDFSRWMLIAALSMDAFSAALGTAVQGIALPAGPAAVISGISALFLGGSMLCGGTLPEVMAGWFRWLSFTILLSLGLIRLLESGWKELIARCLDRQTEQNAGQPVELSLFSARLILRVSLDSAQADRDNSRSLSVREAVPLAVALSMDSLAAGLSTGGGGILPSMAACFVLSMLFQAAGYQAGRRTRLSGRGASLLGGIILLGLAVSRLF